MSLNVTKCVYTHTPSLQATLRARIGRKEVHTMVSTSDLAMTQGRVRGGGGGGVDSVEIISYVVQGKRNFAYLMYNIYM